jgi:hypothetical protein
MTKEKEQLVKRAIRDIRDEAKYMLSEKELWANTGSIELIQRRIKQIEESAE